MTYDPCDPTTFPDDTVTVGADCGVFVDGNFIGVSDGTPQAPFSDLAQVLTNRLEGQRVFVKAQSFTGDFRSNRGGPVFGGLSETWSRAGAAQTELIPTGAAPTLILELGGAGPARMASFTIRQPVASPIGENAITVIVADGMVSFERCTLHAGAGAAGSDGSDGPDGPDGADGSVSPTSSCPAGPVTLAGGALTCRGVDVRGGNAFCAATPQPGENGQGPNGSGGPGGMAVCTAGGNGASGQAGTAGMPGPTVGAFELRSFVNGKGGDGQPGSPGGGGGGGGNPNTGRRWMSGGSGGCGGAAGVGGGNGGASFAIVAIDADLVLTESALLGGMGGPGGKGGRGGAGGDSGDGALDTVGGAAGPNGTCRGGNGGAGGPGGPGAGGAGGPSALAVTVGGGTIMVDATTAQSVNTTSAASGGPGGLTNGLMAPNGPPGLVCARLALLGGGNFDCAPSLD